jgi:hypothetical protein
MDHRGLGNITRCALASVSSKFKEWATLQANALRKITPGLRAYSGDSLYDALQLLMHGDEKVEAISREAKKYLDKLVSPTELVLVGFERLQQGVSVQTTSRHVPRNCRPQSDL